MKRKKIAVIIICFIGLIFLGEAIISIHWQKRYMQVQNYIWVKEKWGENELHAGYIFLITQVKNGHIEGKICRNRWAYIGNIYESRDTEYVGTFSGDIIWNNVKCYFVDEEGNKGEIRFEFTDKDRIYAEIELSESDKIISMNMKPYNVSDTYWRDGVSGVVEAEEQRYVLSSDGKNKILVLAEEIDTQKFLLPTVFITDENRNIFCELSASYKTGTQVKDIVIDDFNNDGRNDIKVITEFIEDSEMENVEFLFYQSEESKLIYRETTIN